LPKEIHQHHGQTSGKGMGMIGKGFRDVKHDLACQIEKVNG